MTNKNKFKNVWAIQHLDAGYAFTELEPEVPEPKILIGFIVESNNRFVHIATKLSYNKKENKIKPKSGFLIPIKNIYKKEKINTLP